ncbi:Sigma-fimbriae chaperone protein [Paraburkholderia caribensis MBA4]|uniref:Sigma-fimbriae chaperone protein n=2 Tax=Paraburkholderia caribensis TaxID=75105 RepID=A0A0P0R5C2_9BURK|nr:Sigma-fimbriae chaperone protein [Paraburkholderia caribensis MBA4]
MIASLKRAVCRLAGGALRRVRRVAAADGYACDIVRTTAGTRTRTARGIRPASTCRGLLATALWCVAALHMGAAHAAALQVTPIRLDLAADRPAAVLTLHNVGTAPLNAQVRVFAWSQSADEDHLERTDDIVASPPIVQVAPGADQTVRILRVAKGEVSGEETYRLLIDEIPSGQSADATGVRMQLRYSVPVFVGAPPDGKPPALQFALERAAPDNATQGSAPPATALMLRAVNRDATHAQLSKVKLTWHDGQSTLLTPGLLGYALAHATRRWPVANAPADAREATLSLVVNGQPVTARVRVESGAATPADSAPAR